MAGLLTRAGRPTAKCVSFDGYIDALESVHAKGKEGQLNLHFRPQGLNCGPLKAAAINIKASLNGVAEMLSMQLSQLHKVNVDHSHRTTTSAYKAYPISKQQMQRLCRIAAPEYEVIGTVNGHEDCAGGFWDDSNSTLFVVSA